LISKDVLMERYWGGREKVQVALYSLHISGKSKDKKRFLQLITEEEP
jgi:hypothetical protein